MSASSEPIVSIIIPVVNNLKHNRECLESLFEHTPASILHEIIIVDNNSTDGSLQYFQSLGQNIRLIANSNLRTFAESCNQGAKEAKGEFLLFLNNDTYVTAGWLPPLLTSLQKDQEIGLLANKQLFPGNGSVSHVGGAFTPAGTPEHLYLFFDPNLPFLNRAREMQWVTACCIMISKTLFKEVSGFDQSYKNSYEDLDLCFKIKSKGRKVFYCPESIIYHYGQATVGRKDQEEINGRLFQKKWGDKIKYDLLDIVRNDLVENYLKSNHHLERLLYERYLLMHKAVDLENEISYRNQYINNRDDTLRWKITKPLRDAKQMAKQFFKEDF